MWRVAIVSMSEATETSGSPVPNGSPHLWQIAWVRDLFWLALLTIGLVLAWYTRAIIQPVLLALLFAYLINPLFTFCEQKWNWSRSVAVCVLFGAAATTVLAITLIIAPLAVSQTADFVSRLPDYIDVLARKLGVSDETTLEQLQEQAAALLENPVDSLSYLWDGFVTTFGVLRGVMGTMASIVVGITLFPVCLFVFSCRFPALIAGAGKFVPASRRQRLGEIAGMMDNAVGDYFRTRLLIALIMGAMYAAGWGFAGVPYWLLIGLLAGLLGVIPYAAGLAWLIAVLLTLLELKAEQAGIRDAIQAAIWPTVVFAVVQSADDWALSPWLQGRELKLSFLTIMLAVLIGGALAGLLGMLLAVPAAACVRILWVEVIEPRLVEYARSH